MLQTVIILIGKYQLKDDVLFVVNQRVFYTTTTACCFRTFNSATNIFLCPQIFPFCPHFFNPKGSLSPTVKIHGRTLLIYIIISPYKRTPRAFDNFCYGGSGIPYASLHKHGCSSAHGIRALH